jgi:hypothetical protein
MKPLGMLTFTGAVCGLCLSASGGMLLQDDFSGAEIDTNVWTVILPVPQASVTQTDGQCVLAGGGAISPNRDMPLQIEVSGTIRVNHVNEIPGVALRSDLSTWRSPYGNYRLSGMLVKFSFERNSVLIEEADSKHRTIIAEIRFPLRVGQTYDFIIRDTGTSVSVSIGGKNLASVATTWATGNRMAFQVRDHSWTSTDLDRISITGSSHGRKEIRI